MTLKFNSGKFHCLKRSILSLIIILIPAFAAFATHTCRHCACSPKVALISKDHSTDLPDLETVKNFWNQTNLPEGLKNLLNTSKSFRADDVKHLVNEMPLEQEDFRIDDLFIAKCTQYFWDQIYALVISDFRPRDPVAGEPSEYKILRPSLSSQRALLSFVQAILIHVYRSLNLLPKSASIESVEVFLTIVQLPDNTADLRNGIDKRSLYQKMLEDRFGFEVKKTHDPNTINYSLRIKVPKRSAEPLKTPGL
ncbi:MAG: hypothetical protein JWQ35_191 [Bacteriovoracaceae bacterium]|nr:hypothetical protein [Bacteriovoracaceae bacterium]